MLLRQLRPECAEVVQCAERMGFAAAKGPRDVYQADAVRPTCQARQGAGAELPQVFCGIGNREELVGVTVEWPTAGRLVDDQEQVNREILLFQLALANLFPQGAGLVPGEYYGRFRLGHDISSSVTTPYSKRSISWTSPSLTITLRFILSWLARDSTNRCSSACWHSSASSRTAWRRRGKAGSPCSPHAS